MQREFTPAAQRALDEAAFWAGAPDDAEQDLARLLLGLLAEPECRAALMLDSRGIAIDAVLARWPSLRRLPGPRPEPPDQLSPAVHRSIEAAELLLFDFPRPLVLATEHLLLGLAAGQGEVSAWLGMHQLHSMALIGEIRALYGHAEMPSEVDSGPETEAGALVEGALVEPTPGVTAGLSSSARSASGEAARDFLEIESEGAGDRPLDTAVLRILDAAANRAREGLRVVEDYVRFVLDDVYLTEELKRLRHDLASVLGYLPADRLHAARDTQADVGTRIATASEQTRADAAAVAVASSKRVQEALRSLEEYGKLVAPDWGARFEQLRYRAYTTEKAIQATRLSQGRLTGARLCVLVDARESNEAFSELVGALVDAGVHVLQLREKRLADRELLERGRLLRRLTAGTVTLFVMNDRPDLARLAGADGVHVGQEELSVKAARSIVGPEALVGVSTHSLDQARAAVLAGANYIGVGPTFPSGTKRFDHYPGVALVKAVAAEIRLPAFAIGGITLENLAEVTAAGFGRVAVSSAILEAANPAAAAREFLRRL